MKKQDIFGLVCIVAMLGGLAALFAFAPQTPEVAFQPVEVPGSSLTFVSADAKSVTVDATLGKAGFVTLHELIGGAPGPILAVSEYLEAGTHAGYTFSVRGGLQPDTDYMLLMTVDGGNKVYDAGVDLPVMVNGEVIRVPVSYSLTDVSDVSQQ